MSGSQPINFFATEFVSVFNRILSYDKKDGYHQLRQLNKSFQQKFDDKVDTAIVEFSQLQQLVTSQFANKIKVLTVRIPDSLEELDELHLISPVNLPNIKKVNINFIQTAENYVRTKEIRISQPLILRGVSVACDSQRNINIRGTFDVSIIDSNFSRVELELENSNKVFVKNTAFKYQLHNGFVCQGTSNGIKMEDVEFLIARSLA